MLTACNSFRHFYFLRFVLTPLARGQSTPSKRHGIAYGTFSNLRYIQESGDLIGTEVTIIPQGSRHMQLSNVRRVLRGSLPLFPSISKETSFTCTSKTRTVSVKVIIQEL